MHLFANTSGLLSFVLGVLTGLSIVFVATRWRRSL